METPLVSVVIVNYNGAEVIRPCLRSLASLPFPGSEVIVVDNGSTDGSVEAVALEFPQVRLIRNGSNLGFAQANNIGVAEARGEYVILLNNDTEVTNDWIPPLLEMLKDPGVAVVTSKVVTDGVPPEYYTMNGTINYLGYNIMRHFPDLSTVFFAGGASLMFRKSEVLRPFPDEYFLYHEDVHLSLLMRLSGRKVKMAQSSVVMHRGSVSTKQQPSSFVTFYQERNRMLNILCFFQVRTLVLLVPYMLADIFVKLLLSLLIRRKSFVGILRAYWWIVMNVGWILRHRHEIQSERKVADRDILKYMSSRVLDSESPLARLINACSQIYARGVGLATHG